MVSGRPSTLHLPFDLVSITAGTLDGSVIESLAHTAIGGSGGDNARAAVAGALIHDAGISLGETDHSQPLAATVYGLTAPVLTAARRFAALPAATRRAWLDSNWSALRAGHITLGGLP